MGETGSQGGGEGSTYEDAPKDKILLFLLCYFIFRLLVSHHRLIFIDVGRLYSFFFYHGDHD